MSTSKILYRQQILDHYKNPRNYGKLGEKEKISHCEENTSCGDKICMEIFCSSENFVQKLSFHGIGCAISQASASMLTEYVLEAKISLEEIMALNQKIVIEMLGIELSPIRLKCALLPLETLQKTVKIFLKTTKHLEGPSQKQPNDSKKLGNI